MPRSLRPDDFSIRESVKIREIRRLCHPYPRVTLSFLIRYYFNCERNSIAKPFTSSGKNSHTQPQRRKAVALHLACLPGRRGGNEAAGRKRYLDDQWIVWLQMRCNS